MGGWGASLTAALIPLPAGSDPTAAARGNYMAPGRKPAEGRLGPGGSEYAGGDTDGRDHAAESGVSRSPGESCASTCSCTLLHAWKERVGGHKAGSRTRVISAWCAVLNDAEGFHAAEHRCLLPVPLVCCFILLCGVC